MISTFTLNFGPEYLSWECVGPVQPWAHQLREDSTLRRPLWHSSPLQPFPEGARLCIEAQPEQLWGEPLSVGWGWSCPGRGCLAWPCRWGAHQPAVVRWPRRLRTVGQLLWRLMAGAPQWLPEARGPQCWLFPMTGCGWPGASVLSFRGPSLPFANLGQSPRASHRVPLPWGVCPVGSTGPLGTPGLI